MRSTNVAIVLGLGVLVSSPQVISAADQPAQQQQEQSQRQLREAIQKLQQARYDLALAERRFGGERGDSLQQTQYAIEQLFAALNDDRWKEEDRKLWEKQSREVRERVESRQRRETGDRGDAFTRANSGLENLREARRLVDRVEGAGFGGHKSKALVHIDEAIKAMEKGIEGARERDR